MAPRRRGPSGLVIAQPAGGLPREVLTWCSRAGGGGDPGPANSRRSV